MLKALSSFKLWNIAPSSVQLSALKYVKGQILWSVEYLPSFPKCFVCLKTYFECTRVEYFNFCDTHCIFWNFLQDIHNDRVNGDHNRREIRLKGKILLCVSWFKKPRNLENIVLCLTCFIYFLLIASSLFYFLICFWVLPVERLELGILDFL